MTRTPSADSPCRIPSKEPIPCGEGSRLPWPIAYQRVVAGRTESQTSSTPLEATPAYITHIATACHAKIRENINLARMLFSFLLLLLRRARTPKVSNYK